jgi:hypothetical protein
MEDTSFETADTTPITKSSSVPGSDSKVCFEGGGLFQEAKPLQNTPIGKVACPYFEKSDYDYFALTPKGDVVCLLPFMPCTDDDISAESSEIDEAIKYAFLGKPGQEPRIMQVLDTYLNDLIRDFQLMGLLEDDAGSHYGGSNLKNFCNLEIRNGTSEISKKKATRYLQLKRYQTILTQVLSDQGLKNDLSAASQVVVHRDTKAIPLEVFCNKFATRPWLKNAFDVTKKSPLPLPKASELILEDNLRVLSNSPVSKEDAVPIMERLTALIENAPKAVAEILLHETTDFNVIYSLLSENEVSALLEHEQWPAVSTHAMAILSNFSNEDTLNDFRQKFRMPKYALCITQELEQALYAAYAQLPFSSESKSDLTHLDKLGADEKRMKAVLENILSAQENPTVSDIHVIKTAYGNYIAEFSTIDAVNFIKTVADKNKNSLYISPDMADSLLEQVGESANNWDYTSSILKLGANFPLAMRALFPGLTIVVSNRNSGEKREITGLPEGKELTDSDVIIIEFNPVRSSRGYQVTSSNPDNLRRIRDSYESSIFHTLTVGEAETIVKKALYSYGSSKGLRELYRPVILSQAVLELALSALGIVYSSLREVNGVYKIACNNEDWQKILNNKNLTVSVNSETFESRLSVVSDDAINQFFTAIKQPDINEANRLLLENPKLLGKKEKTSQCTPLLYALDLANATTDSKSCAQLLDFCLYLLEQPGIELTSVDKEGNTALHKSMRYAHQCIESNNNTPSAKSEHFDKVSLALFEKARQEGIEDKLLTAANQDKDTIFGRDNKYDPKGRMHFQFMQQTLWNLYAETRYYNLSSAVKTFFEKIYPEKGATRNWIIDHCNIPHRQTKKTLLECAIEKGDSAGVSELLKLGADPNIKTSDGKQTLVQRAVTLWAQQKESYWQVKFNEIIGSFALEPPKTTSLQYLQPVLKDSHPILLEWAIKTSKFSHVQKLIELGMVDPNSKTSDGEQTFIQLAIIVSAGQGTTSYPTDKEKIQADLLKKVCPESLVGLLELAIKNSNVVAVTLLLKHCAFIENNSNQRHAFQQQASLELAIKLYWNQTEPKEQTKFANIVWAFFPYIPTTAYPALLEWAIRKGDADKVKILLEAKADPNVKMANSEGTLIALAATLADKEADDDLRVERHKIIERFIYPIKEDVAVKPEAYPILLELAIKADKENWVRDLIAKTVDSRIDLNAKTRDGTQTLAQLALRYAKKGKLTGVISYLVNYDASAFVDLAVEIDRLNEYDETFKKQQVSLDEAKAKNAALEQEKEEFFKAHPEAAKQYEEKNLLTQNTTALQAKCDELQKTLNKLQEQAERLEGENSKFVTFLHEKNQEQLKLEEKRAELLKNSEQVTSELSQGYSELQKLQLELLDLQSKSRTEKENLEKTKEKLSQECISEEKSCEILQQRLGELNKLKSDTENKISETGEATTKLLLRLGKEKEEEEKLKKDYKPFAEVDAFKNTIEENKQTIETLNGKIIDLTTSKENAEKTIGEKDTEINKLNSQLRTESQAKSTAESNLNIANQTILGLKQLPGVNLHQQLDALILPEGLSDLFKANLEENLLNLRAVLRAEVDAGVTHHGEVQKAITLTKTLIDDAIVPFTKQNVLIDMYRIQQAISDYDQALLSLSRNQKIGVAGAALLGAVVGMIAGFLLGFALGAALSPDVTSVNSAFKDLFSAFVLDIMGKLSTGGMVATIAGTVVGTALASGGAGYLTNLAFFKTDPIKPEAQDLLSVTKLFVTPKQS